MLLELRIENLLVIERAELRFGAGLNAITGETGAGKTVLAHSLDLLMGGRARPQIVRPGAPEAYVEGVFAAPEGLLDDPELATLAERVPEDAGEVVLGRRVGASGRTSAFVQGRSASAADLQALGGRLLAFFGQHEHRKLTLAATQLEVLDGFAGSEHLDRRRRYRRAHAEVGALRRELAELADREGARERELDLLRFELSEIEAVAPDAPEEAALGAERQRLRHAERLRQAAGGAALAIAGTDDDDGGARALFGEAEATLAAAAGVDPELDGLAERLRAAALELEDLAGTLRGYLDRIEAEPGRLEAVEERLAAVERLKRKHGGTVEEVLAHGDRCRAKIERLENAEELAGELDRRIADAAERRARLASALTESRRRAARRLERRVGAELAVLAMEGAKLEVVLEPAGRDDDGFGHSGAETVELRVATNPGIPPSPLRDAASGGELSRVMLALSGLGPATGARTTVFDEIDGGIGADTAKAVGERLNALAEGRQLICITHLPQIASLASTHFRISKRVVAGTTTATVEAVNGEAVVAEIVRMLGGETGDGTADRHARELLAAA